MITDLKPYPEMRDSGVEWLGDVPKHWAVEPIARLGPLFKGRGGSKDDEVKEGVPCVRYGDLYTRYDFFIRDTKAYVTPEHAADYTRLEYGDVLFAASGETIEDIGRSAVNLMEAEACCGGDILVFRPRAELAAGFLGYAAGSTASRHQKACMGRGFTVVHIYGSELKRLALPVPPVPEQATIVRFLDHADRRIRRYIRAKERLIELLEEQKQSIIHRAVTRGLDPDVPLRDSGVEWLGEVPEHWEVTRVKSEFECLNHRRIPLSSSERGEMTLRRYDYYGASGVIDRVDDYLFDDELLLIAEDGANLVLRNLPLAIIARGRFWVNNHAHVLKPRRGNLDLLAWTMEAISYEPWISGAAQPKLTKDRLMGISIAVPPREEQHRVVRCVSEQTRSILEAAARAKRELSLLRELRTRLIVDVVTGKLDVREVAARLPDEQASVDEDDDPNEDDPSLEDADLDAELEEIEA